MTIYKEIADLTLKPTLDGTEEIEIQDTGGGSSLKTTVDAVNGLVVANDIGPIGAAGCGVGRYPGTLPSGFSAMLGTDDPLHDNHGNYQYSDGSVVVWVPAFYYKVAADNTISIASIHDYATTADANSAGYALHRAFIDGGQERNGFFIDKYQCSNNSGIASSIALGNPISTNSAHNPISALNGSPPNNHYSAIDAVKTRAAAFAVCSRFIYSALAMLSIAHGQAATAATYCAWYDGTNVTNYPKGCNNNALGDTNDGAISYTSDGYSSCGKTGSGLPFAKTTHNGQACGVADLNGNMWEVSLGLVRPGSSSTDSTAGGSADFYVLKESVAIADITSGWDSGNAAWGGSTHLATLYDVLTASHLTHASAWERHGNASNQVLSEAASGNNWLLTGLGLPKDATAQSAGGTNLFGSDGVYEYWRANLCGLSGGAWGHGSLAGLWAMHLDPSRSSSNANVGFRAACYL